MSRRLPSLNALKCFEVVAEHLSIKKAAIALHISESAISRQVRILEQQLGVGLFHRKATGLEITEAGRALAASTSSAFDQIADTVETFKCNKDTVQIKVLPSFAIRWLYPRLQKFQSQHPLIRVIVHTRWHNMESGDGGAHLGIRYGPGNWPGECITELYREWLVPVCAPGYLSGRKIKSAKDFEELTLLHPLPDRLDWAAWSKGWAGGEFDISGGLDFDGLDLALRAAMSGFGIAITDVVLANDDISAGRLVIPVSECVPSGESYYVVRTPEFADRRQVGLLYEWICAEISDANEVISSYTE